MLYNRLVSERQCTVDHLRNPKRKENNVKLKHIKAMCQKMRDYFVSYEGIGAPSFEKFAAMMSISTLELRDLRSVPEFEAAYRECCAIRRDYLIDRGLEKKFDSSLVKLLITTEKEDDLCVDGAQFTLSVEVVG
jgi:hypothetical protein